MKVQALILFAFEALVNVFPVVFQDVLVDLAIPIPDVSAGHQGLQGTHGTLSLRDIALVIYLILNLMQIDSYIISCAKIGCSHSWNHEKQ